MGDRIPEHSIGRGIGLGAVERPRERHGREFADLVVGLVTESAGLLDGLRTETAYGPAPAVSTRPNRPGPP